MAFRKLPGSRGMIYEPDCVCSRKKNACSDCFSCQWCADDRCRACRAKTDPEKVPPGNPRRSNR